MDAGRGAKMKAKMKANRKASNIPKYTAYIESTGNLGPTLEGQREVFKSNP